MIAASAPGTAAGPTAVSAGRTRPRAFFFTRIYSPYKPYLDAQFSDFLERGWDVGIFASRTPGELSRRARRFALAGRVQTYPTTLADAAEHLPRILARSVREPERLAWGVRCGRAGSDLRDALRSGARAASVAPGTPAFCLVHELETAVAFRWLRRRYPGATLAMHYHGGEIPTIPRIPDALAAQTFAAFDVVFTNTRFSAGQVVERGGDPGKVVVLPVGFALEDFRPPDPRAYRRDGVLRLLAAGRLSVEKGFPDAVEAVARLVQGGLREIRLDIVGDGPLLEPLRATVEARGLGEHVRLEGRLDHEELVRRMGEVDGLLLPSRPVGNWAETQACVLQEAMLMRTPVVAARTGGVPESVAPALLPFCPDAGDPASLVGAIGRLAALRAEGLAELGRQSEAFARARYDVRELDDRLLRALPLSGPEGASAGGP